MRDFLDREEVKFTYLRYFENGWKRTASAQLNVSSEYEQIVGDESFWPEGINVRPWLPRQVFWSEHYDGNSSK